MTEHASTQRLRAARRRQRGLTLVEILVVIVILGVLGAIVAVNVLPNVDRARTQAAETQIDNFTAALQSYYLDHSTYPTTQQGLEALITPPRDLRTANRYREGGYLAANSVPVDPWQRPYEYQSPGEFGTFDLYSLGRDGQPGGEGPDADVTNWE
ncbi:type II secretion system major pseudopilin GspG [Parvularcula dongshanensis]|uniref:Type II secretion system core protein G n=1 Tax=Parvularcula dongshanensis TaxID=1173995 RepID=A0A840I082_9PROT|nr:type II secretion system major pseudopilin GspG [Parvularcula dongshanensis]MBB4657622.1 general secretion pathway protein G [Parvularcula dongshanensis]